MRAVTRPAATEDAPCNLCGRSDYDVVGRRDREGHALRTVICRSCGLVWTNPRPAAGDVDRYYATAYRADYTGSAAPARRKILRGLLGAQERRRLLRGVLRDLPAAPPPKVLDVGCGAGEFVYLLRQDGVDASGLEPGGEYADFARRVLGIPVLTATVDAGAIDASSQDVVTMFHALEHVADPRQVLRTVRGWVRRGGLVVVEVPNVDATVQAPPHRFHYAHLHNFSGATLAAVGEAAGLRLVRTFFSGDGGNVTCIFRRDADEERLPRGLADAAARTRDILRTHTTLRHLLTPAPYVRPLGRLRQRWRENRLLSRLRTIEDMLRWAAEQA